MSTNNASLPAPAVRRQWLSDVAQAFHVLACATGKVNREGIQRIVSSWPPLSTLERLVIEGLIAELYTDKGEARSAAPSRHASIVPDPAAAEEGTGLADLLRIFIDEHYHEPLTIARLCRLFRCSRSRLELSFRSTYARTIHAYLTQRRTEAALNALRHSSTKIEVIAMETGYRSKKDFYRVVKTATGLTPRQVRRG